MRLACAFCCAVSAWGQSGLDRPWLGMMLDAEGRARPVLGVAASVTLGAPEGGPILSLACSRGQCLFKTETGIVANGLTVEAPPGPALFALAGDATIVYFPLSRQCAQWKPGAIDPLPLNVIGEVLSLRVRSGGDIEFAVRRGGATWIVNAQDETVGTIPSQSGPVLFVDDGVLYTSSGQINLRHDDGSEIHFPAQGVEFFSAMNHGYVQVRTRRTNYAIRTTPGRERMFQLPNPSP
jgi:hypothetical protein